jgi:FtsZ-binding cell division protein ZapB
MTGQEITAVMTLLGKNNRRGCNMQEHTICTARDNEEKTARIVKQEQDSWDRTVRTIGGQDNQGMTA